MAFKTTTVAVGVTATSLATPTTGSVGDPVPVVIFNNDPTVKLFIGGADVTVATGFPVIPQSGIGFRLLNSDPIFGIVAAGTVDARVLIGRS